MRVHRAKKLNIRCPWCFTDAEPTIKLNRILSICPLCFEQNVKQSLAAHELQKSKSNPATKRTVENYYDSSRTDFHSDRSANEVLGFDGWTQTLKSLHYDMRPGSTYKPKRRKSYMWF